MKKKVETWITVCDFCDRTAGEYKCAICGKDLCKIHTFELSNKEHAENTLSYIWGPRQYKTLIKCFCPNHLHEDLVQSLASRVKKE